MEKVEIPCITDERECGECKAKVECRVYFYRGGGVQNYFQNPERYLTPDSIRLCYCCSLDYVKKGYEPLLYSFNVPKHSMK